MAADGTPDDDCSFVWVRPADGKAWQACARHTYFGNGIEPNHWPCQPETRHPVSESGPPSSLRRQYEAARRRNRHIPDSFSLAPRKRGDA